jgi:hypothetical protein
MLHNPPTLLLRRTKFGSLRSVRGTTKLDCYLKEVTNFGFSRPMHSVCYNVWNSARMDQYKAWTGMGGLATKIEWVWRAWTGVWSAGVSKPQHYSYQFWTHLSMPTFLLRVGEASVNAGIEKEPESTLTITKIK